MISCFPRPDGGIGRRTSFRYWRVKPWRFESSSGHQVLRGVRQRLPAPLFSSGVVYLPREASHALSKLYDHLKNAVFSRKQALEKKARKPARAKAAPVAAPALADQKIIDDESGTGRKEIAGALSTLAAELQHNELDGVTELREREATMAKRKTTARSAERMLEDDGLVALRSRGDDRDGRAHQRLKALEV